MNLIIQIDGTIQGLHGDMIPLQSLGRMSVRRASNIEFNESTQLWQVVKAYQEATGVREIMFIHESRQECLNWEHDNWEKLI